MAKHNIDIAWFRCECGHRSTPPSEVNAIAHEMEFYRVVEELPPVPIPIHIVEGEVAKQPAVKSKLSAVDEQKIKTDTEKEYKGNGVCVVEEGNKKIAKFNRSHSVVKLKSATKLEESDHIVLGCPNCGRTLYEVKY
jgi:hypothetical protein